MTNKVFLIAVPKVAEGLASTVSEADLGYSCQIKSRQGWPGHLW